MKHFVGKMSKRSQLFIIILVLLGGTSAFASSVKLQTATPYPTDYPPDWQTADAIQRQTQEVAALTPLPTGTFWYFPPVTFTPGPTEPPPPATPVGVGVIIDPYRD